MNAKLLNIETAVELASEWLELEGVEGIGMGEFSKQGCILVLISRPQSEMAEKIPETFKGYPVVMQFIGNI